MLESLLDSYEGISMHNSAAKKGTVNFTYIQCSTLSDARDAYVYVIAEFALLFSPQTKIAAVSPQPCQPPDLSGKMAHVVSFP